MTTVDLGDDPGPGTAKLRHGAVGRVGRQQHGTQAHDMPGMDMPGGLVAHCELGFGDAVLMLGSAMAPQNPAKKACLSIYVKDCDAIYKAALSAGARSIQEPADQFYGDRSARFEDPFGNEWGAMTHIKDVSEKEMKKLMAQMTAGAA